MQPNEHHLRYTAYHESGHAVMAYIHGVGLDMVSLAGSFNCETANMGEVFHSPEGPSLIVQMQITLAGPQAGKWIDNSIKTKNDHDKFVKQMKEWCEKIGAPSGDEQFQVWIDAVADTTQRLLDTFRPWIETVAEELLKRRVLSGEEVTKLIRDLQDKAWDEEHPENKEAA